MSDDPQTTSHPFDALASYADGSANPTERETAQVHLGECERCRRDVALASAGRSALRALPEVEAPDLVTTVTNVLGLDEASGAAVASSAAAPDGPAARTSEPDDGGGPDRAQRRARRWQAVWGAGIAAAAVLAAVLIYMGVVSGGNAGGRSAAPAASAPSDTAGQTGVPLDTKAVDRLATSLAGGRSAAPAAAPPLTGGAERAFSSQEAEAAEACVRSAGGVDPTASLTEVLPATFQGTAAYLGAFEVGNQVQVIVASREGCQPLYVASARKG